MKRLKQSHSSPSQRLSVENPYIALAGHDQYNHNNGSMEENRESWEAYTNTNGENGQEMEKF